MLVWGGWCNEERKRQGWATDSGLLQELTLVHSREGDAHMLVPFVQEYSYMIDRKL